MLPTNRSNRLLMCESVTIQVSEYRPARNDPVRRPERAASHRVFLALCSNRVPRNLINSHVSPTTLLSPNHSVTQALGAMHPIHTSATLTFGSRRILRQSQCCHL